MGNFWKGGIVLVLLLLSTMSAAAAPEPATAFDFAQAGQSSSADVRVIPRDSEPGGTHTILVSGLLQDEDVTIRILYGTPGETVYSTNETADANGRIDVTVFTTLEEEPGVYTVEVLNESDEVIGTAEFTVLDPPGRMGTVSISPESGDAGTTFLLEIADARPFVSLDVVVRDEGLLPVFRTTVRADVDGMATVEFPSERDLSGTYSVTVNEGEYTIAQTEVEISAAQPQVEITVRPAEAEPGEEITVSVSGLEAEAEVLLSVSFAGAELVSETVTADVNGNVIYTLETENAAAGEYTVTVSQDDAVITEATYAVTGSPVTIVAGEAVEDETALLSVRGLQAGEDVTVELLQAGEVVDSFPATADVNGNVIVRIPAEDLPTAGDYDVRVLRGETPVASTGLTVVAADAASDVTIATTRELLRIGDSFMVRVAGLEPGETVTFEIRYDDETVFSTERTADESGSFSIELVSEEGDDPGQYELVVIRDGEDVSTALLTIEAAAEQPVTEEEVMVTAVPDSVVAGDSFTLTVEGLQAGETVTVDLRYDGESVYTAERVADENGSVELRLTAEESDQPGDYDVVVLRDDQEIAAGTFSIGEATTAQPSGDVTVTSSPEEFAQGESFVVTVDGLGAGETVMVDVRYDGESVFSTERTADDEGVIELRLTSSEEDEAGDYEVIVLRDEEEIASGTFAITPITTQVTPSTGDVAIDITPEEFAQGDDFTVTISGLEAEETITVDVRYDGESVFTTERTAADDGTIELLLTSTEEDESGEYEVVVLRDDEIISSNSFAITAEGDDEAPEEDVAVVVDPDTSTQGDDITVTVSGLQPGESVTLDILFDGESVFVTERTADDNGRISLQLTSSEEDQPGRYVVVVERDGSQVGAGSFTLAAAGEETPPEEVAEVEIAIEPDSGPLGTTYNVTVTGLEPGETVGLEILFEGEVDFSAERTADDSGTLEIPLTGEEGDPPGDYTVNILRGDEVVASGTITLEESITEQPDSGDPGDEEPEEVDPQTAGETTSEIIDGSLTQDMPEERITFSGEAGDTVLISLSSNDFDTYLVLFDDEGNQLEFNDDSNQSLNSQIGPFSLPYSGEYTVLVSSYAFYNFSEVAVGEYELVIERVGLSEIAYGETVEVTITEDSFTQFFSFEAAAGDVISVTVDSDGSIDTVLSIVDPTGFTVLTDDDGGAGFDPEVMRYVVPTSGTYTLTLRAFTPGTTGTAALTVNLEDQRTLDEQTRTVVLNAKQNRDVLTLRGEAGEAIQLNIALEEGQPGDLNVSVVQDGVTLMYYQTFGIPSEITLGFVIPQDGEVTIFIDDFSGEASILDVSIERE